MKKLLTFLSSIILLSVGARAQVCQVTASASVSTVCQGNPVTISATAFAGLPANQFFDFNQNQLPQGWSTTGGTNYSSGICGSSLDGTPYFWASTASGVPQIVSADFDVCSGGYLQFEMRYAVQGGSSPCEGPDEQDEGISLEYSLDGGVTWIEFLYYRPDGTVLTANPGGNSSIASGSTPFTTWNTYNVPIPPAAVSTSTRFRWVQTNSSGGCCDNWGLDNIGVYAGPCLSTNLVWSNGMSGVSDFTFTPTADTCFTANLYDNNNNFLCSDNVCITVSPVYAHTVNATICQGQTYNFTTTSAVLSYTAAGTYINTMASVSGCDSVVTLNLTLTPPTQDSSNVTICNGDSYTVGASVYNASGTYVDSLSSVGGCDSVFTLHLTVLPPVTNSVNASICQGDTYTLGTQSLTTTGTYQEIFTGADGCDSTVTLHLIAFPIYAGNKDTALCAGVSYTYGGHIFSGAGSYPVLFQTIHGCDSTVVLTITIMPAPVPNAGNDLILCSDEVGNLGSLAVAGITYAWTGGTGLSDDSISDPTVSVHSLVPFTDTYIVTAYFQGCVASDSADVTIIPYPVVNMPPVAPQCLDGNTFAFTPGNSFLPGATFNWNIAGGVPSTGVVQNPSGVHFVAPGIHETSVIVAHGACLSYDTLDVTVYAEPNASLLAPAAGCMPLAVQFQNTSVPAGVTSQWTFGNGQTSSNTSPNIVYTQAGSYDVALVVTTADGCVDSVAYPQLVTAYPLPVAGFTPNPWTVYQDDAFVYVVDNSQGASSWNYDVNSDDYYITPGFTHHFYDTGYHYIHQIVTNVYGCTDEHTEIVHVLPASTIYVPNAFTPGNKDDVNPTFGAYGNNVSEFRMIIFDRWGARVFESNDIDERWDGTMKDKVIKQDVYVYRITYLDHRSNPQALTGSVTLIR